jgi:hypothetical protein
MEEGPEPQEWVERAAEEHHRHEERTEKARSAPSVSAIMAAVLAVLAAVGSLLSGHAANQAILAQSKATDQWAYYQSKSTKSHIYEVAGELVKALTGEQGNLHVDPALKRFRAQTDRYEREKEEVRHQAESLEEESRHEFHKHHRFALGVAMFQVGIVLASVSILVPFRFLLVLSLVAGAAGLVCVLLGLVS